ncbi:MAG: MBL fold metallo-hydrolase [Nanoarchaeota archaeon]|nr:MBL fold metallo-hydrolase [Nanoarchaeota archaeon]
MKSLDINGIKIRWLGHDGYRFEFDGKIMLIDPFETAETEKADIILVTHGHYDHCSIADIQKLTKKETLIATTPDTTSKFSGKVQGGVIKLVKPGDSFEHLGIKIAAVPAYNINKPFHPKENLWVGYIFTIKGIRFYHAGDTDYIPEMADISADVVFLPVSGTYVMTAEEAVIAARKIMPKIAIPMHYGKIVGTKSDAETFAKGCTFCQVKILD